MILGFLVSRLNSLSRLDGGEVDERLLRGEEVLQLVEVAVKELARCFSGDADVELDVDCEYSDSEALRRISRRESWAEDADDERVERKVGKRIISTKGPGLYA